MTTGFFWDERCFWHSGGNFAGLLPVEGLVQPLAAGGLPESPESKRRIKNLMDVTGLSGALACQSAPPASQKDVLRIHPESYLDDFKHLSDTGGGMLGRSAPFGHGGYEIALQSAGLAIGAVSGVLNGRLANAYALSRPPGHHCLPDYPNGFCLLANIAIAIENARAAKPDARFAVVDWDIHHGNGTEAIFYNRADVMTVSVHQDRNYPLDTGAAEDRGTGPGLGYNVNIPLPPGAGDVAYKEVWERIVSPKLNDYNPDIIIIACGFDASIVDPLGRMMLTAAGFRTLTELVMADADALCDGKLAMVHEGGYSESYVPFCAHAVLEALSGAAQTAPDPSADIFARRQPDARADAYYSSVISDIATAHGL